MTEKKKILIFNTYDSQEASFAIKELFAGDDKYLPILFAEYELRGFVQNLLAEKMYGDYSPVRSWWRVLKTRVSMRNMDYAELAPVEYMQKNSRAVSKMKTFFFKYRPSLVLCLGRKSVLAAITAREKMNLNVKIVALISDYALDKRFIKKGVDHYVVPMLSLKALLMREGVPEECISVIPVLVRKKFMEDIDKETATKELGLNPKLPTVMIQATYSYNPLTRKLVKYLKKEKLRMNILVACGYDKGLLAQIQEIAAPNIVGRNELMDAHLAYSASDVVVTRPRSENIAMCIAKHKPIITYDSVGEMEKRIAGVISLDYSVDCNSTEEVMGTLSTFLDNKKAYIKNLAEPVCGQEEARAALRSLIDELTV